MTAPRIAVGAFMLESNGHSPVATREEFAATFLAKGAELEADWRSEHPRAPVTLSGFVDAAPAHGRHGRRERPRRARLLPRSLRRARGAAARGASCRRPLPVAPRRR